MIKRVLTILIFGNTDKNQSNHAPNSYQPPETTEITLDTFYIVNGKMRNFRKTHISLDY